MGSEPTSFESKGMSLSHVASCPCFKVTKGSNKERSLWLGTNCTLLELPSKVCYRYSILMQLGGLGVLGEVTSCHPCWCTLGLIIYAGCILVLVSLVHPLQIWYQPHPPSLISWGTKFSTLPPFKSVKSMCWQVLQLCICWHRRAHTMCAHTMCVTLIRCGMMWDMRCDI